MGFISLYTAFSGLQAAQAGMDTASHNVSNAGTVGFTRQRVDQASRLPGYRSFGPVGTGVDITDITRSRDVMLDARARTALGGESRFATLGDLLSGVEAAMAEPNNGVTSGLDALWASFEELALNPPDTAARHDVLNNLQSLTSRIRSVAEGWQAAGRAVAGDITAEITETNRLLQEVADLNRSILQSGASDFTPNDLLDKRDIAVDRLARLAGVRVSITDSGAARVSLDGLALVHDAVASRLSFDSGTNQIVHSSGVSIDAGGSLGARQGFLETVLPQYQSNLDTFAEELAAALNGQHATGFTPSGSAGGTLLAYAPGAAALTINLAITDASELAAAAGGPPVAEFDGINAEAMAGLRSALAAAGGTQSLGASIRGLVGSVGSATAAAFTESASQRALAASAENARSQIHGVSVDEEMVNLLTSQRAYEAAARVMTAVDQTLDTLINRTGVVGR
jgi:flagellar hook-associated protein 1 FlgK